MKAALVDVMRDAGFEPLVDVGNGDVRLRNCPYRALAEVHRDLTCGANIAWAEGVVDGLDDQGLRAELKPEPGRCCVVVRELVSRVPGR
jgi:predicted ArsR family transcriptional regulator